MAKYTITYSCGHEEEVELFGPMKDRESNIAYYKKYGICSECFKKAMEEDIREMEEELNLPSLEGSEKQVEWAGSIRFIFMIELKKHQDSSVYEAALAFFSGQTEAKFWIDNRETPFPLLVRENSKAIRLLMK